MSNVKELETNFTVEKVDGRVAQYDNEKIVNAIKKAMDYSNEEIDDIAMHELLSSIERKVKNRRMKKFHEPGDLIIPVSEIHNIVIEELRNHGFTQTSHEYDTYKQERDRVRRLKHPVIQSADRIGQETTRGNDGNANVGNNFSAKLLGIASDTNKWRNLARMPKDMAKLHENGDLYFHDLDSYNLTSNCLHVDTGSVFNTGFNTGYGYIRKPKRIESAAELSCILLQSSQNDMFGGQSHVDFDNTMAPFIGSTRDEIREEVYAEHKFRSKKWKENIVAQKLEKRTRQGMQAVVYNLNTMHSRAGSQVPFSSLNIGLPDSEDAAYVCKIFLEEYEKGLGNGEQPIWPNIIFRVKKGVNHPGDKYHYLLQLATRVTSKRMNPTYMNMDADFNLKYYEKGITPATMGCVQGDEVVTYKINEVLYVESFKRMWKRMSTLFEIKVQNDKVNLYMDLENITIFDSNKNDFVDCKRIIRNNDKGDWRKIKFSNGRILLATSDHPLPIINKGRTFVDDVEIGDKIHSVTNQYTEHTDFTEVAEAWLLGFILCDGCYAANNIVSSIALTSEDDIEEYYINAMKKVFDKETNTIVQLRGKKGNYKDLRTRKSADLCKKLEVIYGGVQKKKRQIPNNVFSMSRESRLAFIAGMIDADGYINDNRQSKPIVQIGSTNKELALQTMALAQSVDLPAYVYENHYNKKRPEKIRYRVEFNATSELLNYIVCEKKRNHFTNNGEIYNHTEIEVVSIEELGFIDEFSYDVTTESDMFDVSGIQSHNCRTYICSNVNADLPGGAEGPNRRGNGAPLTINLPRLGLLARGNVHKFFELLDNRLYSSINCLMHRYETLAKLKGKDMPFVIGEKLLMGSELVGPNDSIEPVLKHMSWAIGFIGLAETLVALIGSHHGETIEALELGQKIISHIRDFTDRKTKELKLNFSTYATPAEGLSGKLVLQDREKFGIVPGVTDKEYYTNSFHIPVGYGISIQDKLCIEAPYHALCNGGHITYIEFDGNPDQQTVLNTILWAYNNTNISYIGINFHMRYCKNCGATLNEHSKTCFKCGSTNIQGVSRVTGYLSLDERFTRGKQFERKDRRAHNTDGHVTTYINVNRPTNES